MPSASDFTDRILAHQEDIFGSLALRLTALSLPLVSVPATLTYVSGYDEELFYLDLFRTLLLCCAIQSNISPHVAVAIAQKYDRLSRYISYSMGVVAFRACLRLNLPIPRNEKVEELRRCTQSAFDITSNRSMSARLGVNDFWQRFQSHLVSLETNQRNPQRVIDQDDRLHINAWNQISRKLISSNETWRIWTEWFEFRFMGRPGENVPSFLWGEIEARFISDEQKFNTSNVNDCNRYFAECAIEIVEKFADFQSQAEQISGGPKFEVDEDEQISLSISLNKQKDVHQKRDASSIVDEVLSLAYKMLEECKMNSATYLNESVASYKDAFEFSSWKDPAKVVVRGDVLRSLLMAQLNRAPGSDLPEIQDRTMLVFKSLVRTHNLLVNVYNELSVIDSGLASNAINRSNEAINGLRRIVDYADSKIALTNNARDSLEAVIALGQSKDESDRVTIGITIANFTQATFSFLWKHKFSIPARITAATSAAFGLAQWALANESWLLKLYGVNSEVGALIRATLRVLHSMPLL